MSESGERLEQVFIRRESTADYSAVASVVSSAFETDEEARLVEALRRSPEFVGDLSFVAEVDGHVVGHVMFSRVSLEGSPLDAAMLGLAPLSVSPRWQRRGIGQRLVEHGLEEALRLGFNAVVVVGDPAYYGRFGFSTAARRGLTSTYGVEEQYFMVLELRPGTLNDTTGTVLYSPAFGPV